MVPTTLASVTIFVVLLLPGYVFVRRRQQVNPTRERSAFSEVASVLFAGATFDALVLAIFLAAHRIFPGRPLHLDQFVGNPNAYARTHYNEIALWLALLVLAAAGLAYIVGSERVLAFLSSRSRTPSEVHQSAWWLLFNEQHPGVTRFVSCVLDDGSLIRGALFSFSRASREHPDREVVLIQPLSYRAGARNEVEDLPGVAAVSVSSRRIVTLMVSYVPPKVKDEPSAPPETTTTEPPDAASVS
jgi:hypothetical protein